MNNSKRAKISNNKQSISELQLVTSNMFINICTFSDFLVIQNDYFQDFTLELSIQSPFSHSFSAHYDLHFRNSCSGIGEEQRK